MDMKTAIKASRLCLPIIHNGIKYDRISARITRVSRTGEETYSLELEDYCGSSVMIAPISEVELAEEAKGENNEQLKS